MVFTLVTRKDPLACPPFQSVCTRVCLSWSTPHWGPNNAAQHIAIFGQTINKKQKNGNQPKQFLATGSSYRISYYVVCTRLLLRSKAVSERTSSYWSSYTIYWTCHRITSTWHSLLRDHQVCCFGQKKFLAEYVSYNLLVLVATSPYTRSEC